jgi:DNA-binding CsgD family transcriptional regulator
MVQNSITMDESTDAKNTILSDNELQALFTATWSEVNKDTNDEEITKKYETLSKTLGMYANLNNQFISIFNTKSQKVMYMSKNYLEVLGYSCTEEDYKKYSVLYWMRDLPFLQKWFFLQMTLFFKKTVQPQLKMAKDKNPSLSWYMHNYKFKPPKSFVHHISLSGTALEISENGAMTVMLLIIKDVKSLIKNDGSWWSEFLINEENKYYFHQDTTKIAEGSVLSDRELEILKLIKSSKDTKEIAEFLYVSPLTINKHRNNMLEKTGAKDISSLIQLAEFAKII